MSSESGAAWLFGLGLFAILLNTCSHTSQTATSVTVQSAPQLPAHQWDEKSDCAPGATPNSLANALDPLKAHCDRAKALAKVAGLVLVAVAPEAIGGALAEGEAVGVAASGADAGAAGAAADVAGIARSGSAEAADTSAVPMAAENSAPSRRYDVQPTGERTFSATKQADGPSGEPAYNIRHEGNGTYRVRDTLTGLVQRFVVDHPDADTYIVHSDTGLVQRLNTRQYSQWWQSEHEGTTWEYVNDN